MNGGTCIDGVDNFTCSCPPRLTGSLCECLILEDGSFDCEYISPTFLPNSTQSVISTIINEDISTAASTLYSGDRTTMSSYTTISYGTQARTFTTESEQPIPTTMGMILNLTESTTLFTSIADTTITTTPEVSDDTTTAKEVSEINDKQTKVTIHSDNFKSETTTNCGDNCKEITTTPKFLTDSVTNSNPTEAAISNGIALSTETPSEMTPTEMMTEVTLKTIENTSPSTTDFTTDKMFTDFPTEHSILTSMPPPLVTETPETTSDAGLYTTAHSECTDIVCNRHGICINTPHGIQVCIFLLQFGLYFVMENCIKI